MNTFFKIYIRNVIALAKSIRYKSEITANAINDKLTASGYTVDVSEPSTWRYYMNMHGDYHESNEIMTVLSHDTYETIEFTKENLTEHLLTARNYTLDSRYYKELRDRYPEQQLLIQGIIDPIDIETAISSDDHKILSYSNKLVEVNEGYLIPKLQIYLDNLFTTRHNPDYNLFEPYYYVKYLSGVSTKLVLEILRLRLDACKSYAAHSFHVRQFLMSYSEIGKDFRFMTHSQRMWFYRNLLYINRNIGKKETFDTLVKRVMTARGYSLVGYDLVKTMEGMPDSLTPTVEFNQININGIEPAAGAGDKNISMILSKELDAAPDNSIIYADSSEDILEVGQTSLYGAVPTKVLESNVIDRTDSDPFTMTEITLNHWIYLSYYGYYKAVIQVTNPGNGTKNNLSMKEAFILYLYLYNKGIGIDLLTVPSVMANRVLRNPLPKKAELRPLADEKLIPDSYIEKIIDDQPLMNSFISIEGFRNFCREIWVVLFRHREMRFFSGDYVKEGQLHTLTDRCYMDINLNLAQDQAYDAWLEEHEIDLSGMEDYDYTTMALTILQTCTGETLFDASSMKETHLAMMRIMRNLSSYSVQYLAEINDSSIKVIDGKIPGITNNQYLETIKVIYDIFAPRVMEIHSFMKSEFPANEYPIEMSATLIDKRLVFDVPVNIDLATGIQLKNVIHINNRVPEVSIQDLSENALSGEIVTDNPYQIDGSSDVIELTTEGTFSMTPARLTLFLNR